MIPRTFQKFNDSTVFIRESSWKRLFRTSFGTLLPHIQMSLNLLSIQKQTHTAHFHSYLGSMVLFSFHLTPSDWKCVLYSSLGTTLIAYNATHKQFDTLWASKPKAHFHQNCKWKLENRFCDFEVYFLL